MGRFLQLALAGFSAASVGAGAGGCADCLATCGSLYEIVFDPAISAPGTYRIYAASHEWMFTIAADGTLDSPCTDACLPEGTLPRLLVQDEPPGRLDLVIYRNDNLAVDQSLAPARQGTYEECGTECRSAEYRSEVPSDLVE